MLAHNRALIGVLVLAASVWIGSLVCLVVVAGAARSSLDARARVAFFRALGRRYGLVGDGALAAAIGAGLAMGWPPSSWDSLEESAAAVTAAVVAATAVGVVQARAMTRLRERSLERPADQPLAERVRRGAVLASGLRALIVTLSLAVVALTACVIGS